MSVFKTPPRRLSGKGVRLQSGRPRFDSRLRRGSFSDRDLKIGTPVATLPGAWPYRVSAGTGGPGVRMREKFDLQTSVSVWQHVQLFEHTYNCLSRPVPEIH